MNEPNGTSLAYLDDDGGPGIFAVEEASVPQALYVRVGPVFDGDVQRPQPGVWIEYQYEYGNSRYEGPLLFTPEVWYQLARAVDRRLNRRGWFGWPRRWR